MNYSSVCTHVNNTKHVPTLACNGPCPPKSKDISSRSSSTNNTCKGEGYVAPLFVVLREGKAMCSSTSVASSLLPQVTLTRLPVDLYGWRALFPLCLLTGSCPLIYLEVMSIERNFTAVHFQRQGVSTSSLRRRKLVKNSHSSPIHVV